MADPLVYVLIGAAVLAAAAGDPVDSVVIALVVLANAVVGFVQQGRAEAALSSLSRMLDPDATVLRDGMTRRVSASDIVVGDVVILEPGDSVPADLRLTVTDALTVDESALTGESEPASKATAPVPADVPLADRTCMAHAGTIVASGMGRGAVVASGGDTELGRIARLVASADALQTPLTRAIGAAARTLTWIVVAVAGVTAAVGLLRGRDVATVLVDAAAVAVAAIPEGLPAALTVTMAVGVKRMASRGAVTRKLPAVETLGSTTVVCTDKTGTLTENRMAVRLVETPGGRSSVTGPADSRRGEVAGAPGGGDAGPAVVELLRAAVLVSDAELHGSDGAYETVGDPTEAALLVAAAKAGIDVDATRRDHSRRAVVPFDSSAGWMAARHRDDGGDLILAKGGAERLLARCVSEVGGGAYSSDRWLGRAEELARDGMRVLAVARRLVPSGGELTDTDVTGLELLGLVAMEDPPREAAKAAVAALQDAGIRIKMITGDHPATASAIGSQVGMRQPGGGPLRVVTGADLARLDDEALEAAAEDASVFARVAPEQKLRLVRTLQHRGHVVAMTGDGVNDAPALRQANIGVAMGQAGTEAAKQAADVVLTDDDFATIEAAVEEGRAVFDNIVKFLVFALPTNVGQALIVVAAVTAGAALPLTAIQILWVNLVSAIGLGLVLAVEPKEEGIMRRRPRLPGSPVITRPLGWRILVVGLLLTAVAFVAFNVAQAAGGSDAESRTVAANAFVLAEIGYLWTCRSLSAPLRRSRWFTNRWLLVGIVAVALLQAAFTFAPGAQALFDTAAPDTNGWIITASVGGAGSLLAWSAVVVTRRLGASRRLAGSEGDA